MAASPNPKYLRQLDGLRALSVAAVAWSHWRLCWTLEPSRFPGAEFGVETFFVISGFLITGILLDNRSELSRQTILKQFYLRRFLRIFPVFYATILIGLLLGVTGLRESCGWHVAYLSNVFFYQHGWVGSLSHFWSLAVEEQFYFFWPLLMLSLPARLLRPAILTAMLLAPFYAMAMNASIRGNPTASVLMPSCMSALGLGALIAWSARDGVAMRPFKQWLLFLGLAGMAVWRGCGCSATFHPLNRLAEDCVLGWLVFSAAEGFGGLVGALLAWSPVNYLGKISYGLYIFHNFAPPALQGMMDGLGNPLWLAKIYNIPAGRVAMFTIGTIGVASLSWFCFEKPINDLKRKFPYPAAVN